MDEDVEDMINSREKLGTWVTWLEDKMSGYSGGGWGQRSSVNLEGSAAFKDLEDALWKLWWEFDDSKENNSLMF